ncbi:MAG: FAD-dependent oxidoreductase [Lapillicoccus sp.]
MNARQRVVFVGGGYATLHAYQVLARRRRREIRRGQLELVVTSADDHHSFHGFAGEVLAGALPFSVTRASLRHAMPSATVIPGVVTHVDRDRQVVMYLRVGAPGSGAVESLRYDELVVAPGGREPVQDVPGMAEHGFTLRSPGDVRRLLARLVVLEHPSAGREPADLVVVGGGFAGVELAAALAARPTTVRGRRVHLVHEGPAVLPQLRAGQPGLAQRAERELDHLGVQVHCDVRAVAVSRRHVVLSDGRVLPAALVLATIGQRAVQLPGLESLPTDDTGRLLTTPDLAVAPGIWAAGDVARVNHPRTRTPVPANALWAIKAGDHLGRNLARRVVGSRSTPFRYLGLGQAASFGVGRGVAELYGLPLTGRIAWVTRLLFFIRFMPSHANAVEALVFFVAGRSAVPSVAGSISGPAPGVAPIRYAAVSTSSRPGAGRSVGRPASPREPAEVRAEVA